VVVVEAVVVVVGRAVVVVGAAVVVVVGRAVVVVGAAVVVVVGRAVVVVVVVGAAVVVVVGRAVVVVVVVVVVVTAGRELARPALKPAANSTPLAKPSPSESSGSTVVMAAVEAPALRIALP
jgi:hypothetical protein